MEKMDGKVVIVTGANAGIGLATSRQLARMGATLVMVARSQERGEQALAEVKNYSGNENIYLMLCDLSSQTSIRHFAAAFRDRFDRLDVLVNNAGAFFSRRMESVDGLEMSFALNHMGYFLLTRLLLDMLEQSAPARIVNVSSAAHFPAHINFDDLQHEESYSMGVYGETKLMNLLFTFELARRLEGSGVTVNALHPGLVRTNFGRKDNGILGRLLQPLAMLFARDEDKGAETVVYLASSPDVAEVSGHYFEDRRAVRASKAAYNRETQARLWQASEAALVSRPVAVTVERSMSPALSTD